MFSLKNLIPVLALFFVLIAIRMFEDTLFYDPLIVFFKSDYATRPLPEMNMAKLFSFTALRYVLNTFISLAMLWVLFKKTEILKLSIVLYAGIFTVLMIAFFISLQTTTAGNYMVLFYIRRFLIQPLILLILVPAFYFQLKK